MSLLCWNCRGLGNPQTVQELDYLIRAQDPTVVFVAETWPIEARLKVFLKILNFGNMHVVSKVTQGGGLVLLWRMDVQLRVVSSSLNHVDAIINEGRENTWRFTRIHGALETSNRHISWNLLHNLNAQFDFPWLCAGDFNEILKSHEKMGVRPRPVVQMQEFRDVIDECGFQDLGFVGNKFTWHKNVMGGGTIWERLDRTVANGEWRLISSVKGFTFRVWML